MSKEKKHLKKYLKIAEAKRNSFFSNENLEGLVGACFVHYYTSKYPSLEKIQIEPDDTYRIMNIIERYVRKEHGYNIDNYFDNILKALDVVSKKLLTKMK